MEIRKTVIARYLFLRWYLSQFHCAKALRLGDGIALAKWQKCRSRWRKEIVRLSPRNNVFYSY